MGEEGEKDFPSLLMGIRLGVCFGWGGGVGVFFGGLVFGGVLFGGGGGVGEFGRGWEVW